MASIHVGTGAVPTCQQRLDERAAADPAVMGRARDGSRDAPAEGEYYIQYGARIERALSEAVDNVIEKGSDDWLGALSSSVWELRLKQQEEELAEAKVKRECCEEAVVSVLVLMDPGQDLDDEMFLVLLNALHERGLVECIGCITTLEPARMRAQLARGTLDVLGLLHVPVGAGSDGGAKGSTEQMESVEYLEITVYL